VAIFDRIRHPRGPRVREPEAAPVAAHLLPEVNQRLTIAMDDHIPVSSRVEDVAGGMLQLAYPGLALEPGDDVVLAWERDGVWTNFETRVVEIDGTAAVPTIRVSTTGTIERFDDRRADSQCAIELPIELRIVHARALTPGRVLRTTTTEVGASRLRFRTTAPLAPDDSIEVRLSVSDGTTDTIGARVHVVRMETVPGDARSTCTVVFDELLKSDRARLLALAAGRPSLPPAEPPTQDGIGGRDEPVELTNYDNVLDWLRRRG